MTSKNNDINNIKMGEVFRVLKNYIVILLLSAFIGASVAYLCSAVVFKPEYSSTAKIYVMANEQQGRNNTNVDSGTLQAGALLTKDYEQIIKSPEVLDAVISNLDLKDDDGDQMTDDSFARKISVSVPDETRMVNITVKDEDPYRASDIANAVSKVSRKRILNIMDMNTVKVVSNANIPLKPDGPGKKVWAAIGGLAGLLLAAIIVVMHDLFNNTIQTSEDVQKYLGANVLALIPLDKSDRKRASKRG